MPGPTTVLNSGKTLGEICQVANLPDEARAMLGNDTDGPGFVGQLIAQARHRDAVRFLAHALPTRPAVWWAWYCARQAHGAAPDPKAQAALDATQRWIAQPADENRRAAMQSAEIAEFGTPAGCAGLAAFFAGDSIGPADRDPVPPPPNMTAKIISSCIALAAVFDEPKSATENFKEFLKQGLEVAEKTRLWTAPEGRGR